MQTDTLRPYRSSDYEPVKGLTRRHYETAQEASEAIGALGIAHRVNRVESTGKFSVSVLGAYYVLARSKPSQPWRKVGQVLGSCQYDASENAIAAGFAITPRLSCVIPDEDWPAIQAKQHLRAVGIK
jgi:hypothetical protein